jgi:hypothetical protein
MKIIKSTYLFLTCWEETVVFNFTSDHTVYILGKEHFNLHWRIKFFVCEARVVDGLCCFVIVRALDRCIRWITVKYPISYEVCFCKLVIIRSSLLDKLPPNLVFMLVFYIFPNIITIFNLLFLLLFSPHHKAQLFTRSKVWDSCPSGGICYRSRTCGNVGSLLWTTWQLLVFHIFTSVLVIVFIYLCSVPQV